MELSWNQIDEKWRSKWHDAKDFETDPNNKPKKFITVAYPYPNSPQHIGHGRTYTLADVHSRYYSMKGFNVLFPMGFIIPVLQFLECQKEFRLTMWN